MPRPRTRTKAGTARSGEITVGSNVIVFPIKGNISPTLVKKTLQQMETNLGNRFVKSALSGWQRDGYIEGFSPRSTSTRRAA